MDALQRLASVAADVGLVTRAQAREAGVTDRQLATLQSKGSIARIGRGIYSVGDPLPDAHLIAESWLAVISFESAVAWHGVELPRPVDKVHVSVARSRGRWAEAVPGVRLHRADIAPWDVVTVRGARVTRPLRTAIDIARHAPVHEAVAIADAFIRARRFTSREFVAAATRAKGPGRLRIQLVATLIDGQSGSVLESLTRTLLWQHGLPAPRTQLSLRSSSGWAGRVDFAWPEHRAVLECDGYAYHSSGSDFQRDRRRWSALSAAGWRLGVVTWLDVTRSSSYVVRLVRDLLEIGEDQNTNVRREAS